MLGVAGKARGGSVSRWMAGLLLLGALASLASAGVGAKPKDEQKAVTGNVIGIDLGTTYSCVAVMRGDKVEVIANREGGRTTPSWVALEPETGTIVKGEAAKNLLGKCDLEQSGREKKSCVMFDSKRMIGRNLNIPGDAAVINPDKAHWPFEVVKGTDGAPKVKAFWKSGSKEFVPEEISSYILGGMKETAEDFLGEPVTHAVITVPAYFTDSQRQATKDAGIIAGLNVLRIINEPTAAAIAYGFDKIKEEKNILVYDLGGGTTDVSVLSLDGGVFEVVATSGDGHLGGQDFENRIVEWIYKEIKEHHSVNLAEDPKASASQNAKYARERTTIRSIVEYHKKVLSTVSATKMNIPIGGDKMVEVLLTRSKFESLCMDLFKKTISLVERTLADAKWSKSNVDEIVLVGGSTRIPKVQEMLSAFFGGKALNKSVNPDEAVAYGAAIQGGILTGNKATEDLLLIDVTPLSLGIETFGGVFTKLIPRNSPIPTKKTQIFSTASDNQRTVNIRVLEGERGLSKDNHFLGSFDLTGIPPVPRGQPQIEVTFDVDANGILTVDAVDKGTGSRESIKIKNDKGRLTPEQIEKMIKDAELHKEEDDRRRQIIEARDGFERYLYQLKDLVAEDSSSAQKLSAEDKTAITDIVKVGHQWLEEHGQSASVEIEDFDVQRKKIEKVAKPIIQKLYGGEGGDGAAPEEPAEEGAGHEEL